MAVSISVLVVIVSLHLLAFVLAIGAERRRSTAKVVPDQYDELDYCMYASDASTASCEGVSFLGAEACLLAGSAKNAYHTKYRGIYGGNKLSCETLRKGVFAGGAALAFISMVASVVLYVVHLKADTGGWEKHENGLSMTSLEHRDHGSAGQFEKL
ncbi:hypothetical protein L1987_16237 [Smallanthus sonchifolius]|uniref:Uncharacterized protein n=1 Tax=Smallanthus sonchifolius TaxID=185202 RepID=A0ACB9J9W9_9ASTR|nr:hypothetical protein L1987_16237 [Smallanthus sonchifolius]